MSTFLMPCIWIHLKEKEKVHLIDQSFARNHTFNFLARISESQSRFGGLCVNIWLINKPQQEGIPTKPSYKELFILILQKTSNNN